MVYSLYIFKIEGVIKHLNSFVDKCPYISVYFEGEKMVDHILETRRLLVFGVKCFNCDTAKLNLQDNPAWNTDDIEVVI